MSAEAIALLIAGLIAPWLAQAIKDWLKLSGGAAAWLAFVVSVVVALVAVVVTGGLAAVPWADPPAAVVALAGICGAVFAIATLVYQSLWGKAGLGSVA